MAIIDQTDMTDKLSTLPAWNFKELAGESEIDILAPSDDSVQEHTYAWAWIDKGGQGAGKVRARTFAPDWGIVEEEANGSGSMLLAHQLGRGLIIQHGQGSCIQVAVKGKGIALGGTVIEAKGRRI